MEITKSVMDNQLDGNPKHVSGDDTRDRRWISAVATGDRAAFEALYLHHRPRLVGFLHRNLSRRELIEEVVNETFWVVWRNASRFRGESKVSTWIVGIGYRCMLKALRQHGESVPGRLPVDDDIAGSHATAEMDDDERLELNDWLQHGLEQLSANQRAAIELAYFYGLSCAEIATTMGCATGTVKAWLFHARTRLRNILPPLAGEVVPPSRNRQR